MINPIILAELAKTRQQDLLKEAEYWRLASHVKSKESDKMGMIRRFMTEVIKLRIKFRLFHAARVNDLGRPPAGKGLVVGNNDLGTKFGIRTEESDIIESYV